MRAKFVLPWKQDSAVAYPYARLWNRIARRYARAPIRNQQAYEYKLARTREYMRSDMQLLELGCGTGSTALLHAPFVDNILGVDFSEEMVAIARERAAEARVANVEFRQASVDDFDPAGKRFDMILAMSLLHLLDDRDSAIARIRELLAPGGVFVSSTACLGRHYGFLRLIAPLARGLGLFPMLRLFSDDELRTSIEAAGFAIEESWMPDEKKSHVLFVVARRLG
jgi:SAM-dependent methyltransferase